MQLVAMLGADGPKQSNGAWGASALIDAWGASGRMEKWQQMHLNTAWGASGPKQGNDAWGASGLMLGEELGEQADSEMRWGARGQMEKRPQMQLEPKLGGQTDSCSL